MRSPMWSFLFIILLYMKNVRHKETFLKMGIFFLKSNE